MTKVKIVVDSTADIPRAMAEELGITVIPLNGHFGDKTYLDYVELTSSNFYDLLQKSSDHPRTSQPSPGDFAKVFEELTKDGSAVIAIVISEGLSGTYQSAVMAKDMVPGKRIEVVDTRLASVGIALVAGAAVRAAKDGKSVEEIVRLVNDLCSRTGVVFAVDTLEYLARNGRIGKAQALLGGLLSVKPLLTLEGGAVAPLDKVRGDKKVFPRMVEIMGEKLEATRKPAHVAIAHAASPERAEALAAMVKEAYHPAELFISGLGAVIGTHVGPGTIAMLWHQP